MPIRLVSGLPGSGKTLSAVEWLLERVGKGGRKLDAHRPVFVLGIDSLREGLAEEIGEEELKAWREFPPGSIVLVDEAQKYFPARRAGDTPGWIRDLSEHRHCGIDFVLISQHPSLIDSYVRKLIDQHWHIVRQFGTQLYTRFEWSIVQVDPTSKTSRKSVDRRSTHKYSKAAMGAYKSAELHTIKRRLPRWAYVSLAALVGVPLFAYGAIYVMENLAPAKIAPRSVGGEVSRPNLLTGAGSSGRARDRVATPAEYMAARVPRVPSMPWSAPIYDGLTPTGVPDLRCIAMERVGGRVTCHCYTEQGTPAVGIPFAVCRGFALNGVYNPYRPGMSLRSGDGEFAVDRGESVRPVPAAQQPPPAVQASPGARVSSGGLRGHYEPPGQAHG